MKTLFQRMDLWVRQLVPVGTTLLLLLLNVMPTRIPDFAAMAPALTLMGVFYWTIYRPDLLSPLMAFVIGLLHDVVAGTPLGVNALVLVLVHGAAASQRRFFLGNTFAVAWWGFGVVAMAGMALSWALVSLLYVRLLDTRSIVFAYLMTLSLYPVISWTLARTQVAFLRQP